MRSMKIFKTIAFLVLLASVSGCITSNTVDRAKGRVHTNSTGEVIVDEKPEAGYYWLVPLTVPADIATSPFQLVFIWIPYWAGYRG